MWFRNRFLDRLLPDDTDLLWAPGGTYTGGFRPFVSMARNFLPFVKEERDRYKYSKIWLRYLWLYKLQKKTFQKSAGVIHVSQATQDVVNELIDLKSLSQKVVHHGLNSRFHLKPRQQRAFEDFSEKGPIKLLYVSPIAHYKHQDKLVQSVAKLRSQGFPITVDLVGAAEKKALKHFESLRRELDPAGEWIRWHGLVPYGELKNFYHRADIYACLSSCETFGMILLEAMASGLPILCSDRSALPEINGGACPTVDPEDISAVASGLERLIKDRELRQKCAQAAFERAQSFTWAKCADETFEFLRSVVQGSSGD